MQFTKLQTFPTLREDGRVYLSPHEPSHPRGKLLILINIQLQQLSGLAKLDELVVFIKESYFATDTKNSDNPEAQLENVLSQLNKTISNYLPGVKPQDASKYMAFFIGVLKDDKLFFAKTGKVRILLQHGKALIDVLKQATDDDAEEEIKEFFSYVTTGELSDNDTLLVTTSSLLDYFSEHKLKQILTDSSAQKASNEFTSLVEDFSKHTYFQGLIVKNTIGTSGAKTQPITVTPDPTIQVQSSMNELNALEAKTDDLLSSNFTQIFKKNFSTLLQQIRGFFSPHYSSSSSSEEAIRRRLRQKNLATRVGGKIWLMLKSIGLILFWLGQQISILIINLFKHRGSIAGNFKHKSTAFPSKIQKSAVSSLNKFKTLDVRRRTILVTGIILILILVVSVITGITRKSMTLSRDEALIVIDDIEIKKAAADAALIYGNEQQAANQVAEARRLLNDLETRDKELQQRKSELASSLFEIYKTIQKLDEVNDPVMLTDLGGEDQDNPLTMISLAGSGTTFYGYNDQNTIYEISINQQSAFAIAQLDQNISGINSFTNNQLFIYTQNPEPTLNILNLDNNSFDPVDINFNNPLTEKLDFETYFSRLYVLDPRERQIYRHQQVGVNYGRGLAWVTDATADISDATDMAIDGNVWVVTSSGQLIRLSAGEKLEFDSGVLDPILNSPNFIWTSIDSNKLYILDPPTRRVVILEKDGGIAKQIVSERFDDLKAAAVDEANDKMYILNASQIYEIDINFE